MFEEAYESFTIQRARDLQLEATAQSLEQKTSADRRAESGDLQSPEPVASYLNITKFTLYRLATQKKIPAFKVGNQWRFKKEMIDAWLIAKAGIRKKSD